MKQYTSVIFAILFVIHIVQPLEKEITITIDPGKEDCFYQSAKEGDIIDLDYQVIDGGHGDLDITFHLVDPTGRILVADYKKPENTHRADATMAGDYKFCFDNTFSSYNRKTVFFELIIDRNDDTEWGSDENLDFGGIDPDQIYELKIQDVQEIMDSVRNHLVRVRHLQDMKRINEARDRNVAEENYFKVNTYSFLQLVLMIVVGFSQVVMVKSLFDERSISIISFETVKVSLIFLRFIIQEDLFESTLFFSTEKAQQNNHTQNGQNICLLHLPGHMLQSNVYTVLYLLETENI